MHQRQPTTGDRVVWDSPKATKNSYIIENTAVQTNGQITAKITGVDEEVPIKELKLFDYKHFHKRKNRLKR